MIEVCSLPVESAWCGKFRPPNGTLPSVVGARHAWLHPDWSAPSREDRLQRPPSTRWQLVGICALMAWCVRFFALVFFMRVRSWTFTFVSLMFTS